MARRSAIQAVRPIAAGLAILIFGVYLGMLVARAQPPDWDSSTPLVPTLRCLDGDQDLGAVYQTDDLEIQFHLVNEDKDETFKVTGLHGGCSCTSVTPTELTLAPGEKAVVTAHVSLEGLRPEELPKEFSEVVYGFAETPFEKDVPLRMKAKALVRASYRVEPSALSFGTVIRGDTPQKVVEVECLSPEPVREMHVLSAPHWLDAGFEPPRDGATAFRLSAKVRPDAQYGLWKGAVRFGAQRASGPFVTRSFAVGARVEDDLRALPSSVILAPMRPGETASALVTLQSQRGEAFSVVDIERRGEWLHVERRGSPSPSVQTYAVAASAAREGALEGEARFELRTDSGRSYDLTVPVLGYVTAAPLAG